jgi:hypothetical protein
LAARNILGFVFFIASAVAEEVVRIREVIIVLLHGISRGPSFSILCSIAGASKVFVFGQGIRVIDG